MALQDARRGRFPADGTAISYAEFRRLPEGPGLQVIDGFIVNEPGPTDAHGEFTGEIFGEMRNYVKANHLGKVRHAPFDVILQIDRLHSFQPDVLFVATARLGTIRSEGVFGAPDLVVEALSPSTRRYDLGRKRELYLKFGCRELWIADPASRTIEVDVASRDRAAWTPTRFAGGARVVSEVLPGFSPVVDELFGDPAQ